MRRLFTTASLASGAALGLFAQADVAHAGSNMPQMDFSNPLNGSQVVWLVVILIVLYFILARWALPGVGAVLADRNQRIQRDLDAAHAAKVEADAAVADVHAAIKSARDEANAEVAHAIEAAKAAAAEQAAELSRRLDTQLEKAEAEIAAARTQAIMAIRPIASETANVLLARLTGQVPDETKLTQGIQDALAARGLA
jgi:F-type H+-transporting ATPase subunit b